MRRPGRRSTRPSRRRGRSTPRLRDGALQRPPAGSSPRRSQRRRRGWRGRSGLSRRCWRTGGATRWEREAWAAARAAVVGEVATEARAEARRAAMEAMEVMEARAGSRTGRPSGTATPTVSGPRSCRGSHAFGSWQGSWRPARCGEGEARNAQARVGAEAAGCRLGGRLACGGAMGQRAGRTMNMPPMFVTCATSQSRGWLKLEAPCQVWRGGGEECSGARGCRGGGLQARREARVRWRDGAAARAYPEHAHASHVHVRDLRDVPVQGLVEAIGELPGVERGRQGMLRRCAWVQRRRAAGKAGGSCAVARWGSGPGVP